MVSSDGDSLNVNTKVQEIDLDHCRLWVTIWGSGLPQFVFLHDGLGSVELWRSLPARLADATGVAVLAYDRPGHGFSSPSPTGPWGPSWMQDQASLLPGLLNAFSIEAPILIGHSDGGSIALHHAAKSPTRSRGVVALAPHSFVEARCVSAIAHLRSDPSAMVDALAPYHRDASALFDAWSGGWTDPEFADWDIRPDLREIRCPVLVVQGENDEYATESMVDQTVDSIGSERSEGLILPRLGHMLNRQAPDLILELIVDFADGL